MELRLRRIEKTPNKVALVAALVASFALGIDGTIAYSQASVRASDEECAKPPSKMIKKVAKYSVRKGYVPLTSKILANVNKTKPKVKSKVAEPCDTTKPIAADISKIDFVWPDTIGDLIKSLPTVTPDASPATSSVVDMLPDHAVIAPIVSPQPSQPIGDLQRYSPWWGGFVASQIYFVDRLHHAPTPVPDFRPTKPSVKPDDKPSDPVQVPVPSTIGLVVLGLLLAARKS